MSEADITTDSSGIDTGEEIRNNNSELEEEIDVSDNSSRDESVPVIEINATTTDNESNSVEKFRKVIQEKQEKRKELQIYAEKRQDFLYKLMKNLTITENLSDISLSIRGSVVREESNWAKGKYPINIVINNEKYPDAVITARNSIIEILKLSGIDLKLVQKGIVSGKKFSSNIWKATYKDIDIEIIYDCSSLSNKTIVDIDAIQMSSISGISLWYKDVSYTDVLNNIRKRQFNVMWNLVNDNNDLIKHMLYIHMLEKKGWKCLNFDNIVGRLSNYYHEFATTYSIREDKAVEKCGICQHKVNKGNIVAVMKCTHGQSFHHRCILTNYFNNINNKDKHRCPLCNEKAL